MLNPPSSILKITLPTLRADLSKPASRRSFRIGLALTEALAHLAWPGAATKPSNVIFVNGQPKLADIGLVTDAGDTRSVWARKASPEGPGAASRSLCVGKVLTKPSPA
jgi:hypothetical protein